MAGALTIALFFFQPAGRTELPGTRILLLDMVNIKWTSQIIVIKKILHVFSWVFLH